MNKGSDLAGQDPADLGQAVAQAARRLALEQWKGVERPEPVKVSVELEVSVGLRPDPADLTEMSAPPVTCFEVCLHERGSPPACEVICGEDVPGGPDDPFDDDVRFDPAWTCALLRHTLENEENAVKRFLILLSMHRHGCIELGDPQRVELDVNLPPP